MEGHEKFIYVNLRGAREVYSSVEQTKKVNTKKKVFSTKISTNSSCCLKILATSHEFLSEDQKNRSLSETFYEIRCESTKITKKQFLLANSRAVNTNLGVLGLDLLSSSSEPANFLGTQSSLGGHNFCLGAQAVIWGGTARNASRDASPVSGAGGLTFKSRACQIRYSVATARHRCNISSKEAVLLRRNNEEMGLANSLHAAA